SHRQACRQAGIGYACPHRTGADDGDARYITHWRLLADAGYFRACALCKERVAQALRLCRVLALLEKATFGGRGSVEVEFGCQFDRAYYFLRRYEASRLLRDALARRGKYGIVSRFDRQVTDPPRRPFRQIRGK